MRKKNMSNEQMINDHSTTKKRKYKVKVNKILSKGFDMKNQKCILNY